MKPRIVACIAVAWVFALSGCSTGKNTLTLANYKSINFTTKIVDSGPYAADKFAQTIDQGMKGTIARNQRWSPNAEPKIDLVMEITRVYEPTEKEMDWGTKCHEIDYRLVASDTESGASLGTAERTVQVRIRNGILQNAARHGLIEGIGETIQDKQFENSWTEDLQQNAVINQVFVKAERDLNEGKSRQPMQDALATRQRPPDTKPSENRGKLVALKK